MKKQLWALVALVALAMGAIVPNAYAQSTNKGSATVTLTYGSSTKPAGTSPAVAVYVLLLDANGTQVAASKILCDASGMPTSNVATFTDVTPATYTAKAVAYDNHNVEVSPSMTSDPFVVQPAVTVPTFLRVVPSGG